MKKILLVIFITSGLQAITINDDFARRFGADSRMYNTPLYFDRYRCIDGGHSYPHKKKRSYRKKIRKEIEKESIKAA